MNLPQKRMGIGETTSLVTGNMIGTGVFLLPTTLALYGPISLVGWFITGIGSLFLALMFARLSYIFPEQGGLYAYARHAFGNNVGFLTAWGYWMFTWISNIAVVSAAVAYFSVFFPSLQNNHMLSFAIGLAIIWVFTWINTRGVETAGFIQLLITILKIVILVILPIAGLFLIKWEHFTPLNLSPLPLKEAISASAMLTLWSFLGLESATIPAQYVQHPKKTIPFATILGTVIAVFVYILGFFAMLGIINPHNLANSSSPYVDMGRMIFGNIGGTLIGIGALLAMIGSLNGWILLQGQTPFAAAKNNLLPQIFAKTGKYGAPTFGLILSSILMSIVWGMTLHSSLTQRFLTIINLANATILFLYIISALANLYFIMKRKEDIKINTILIGLMALFYSCWMITSTDNFTIISGALVILSGLPVFWYLKIKHIILVRKIKKSEMLSS